MQNLRYRPRGEGGQGGPGGRAPVGANVRGATAACIPQSHFTATVSICM
jgi:hypothetical protein